MGGGGGHHPEVLNAPPLSRPGWDEYFLGIADAVAARTDCRRARVGAVVVDPGRRIVATGYPGTAPGRPGCLSGACPRGLLSAADCPPLSSYDNCISVHAEANALLHSDIRQIAAGTIYITRSPCDWCLKLIQASGLMRVVFRSGQRIKAVDVTQQLQVVQNRVRAIDDGDAR